MRKVALIGANGQVGAELCLMLADRPDLRLVPICRTRSGSAYLRWQGIPCRHGRVADPQDAARLLSDCDVVVNCSLAAGTPAEIRAIEDRIAHNACAYSMPRATVIHFSTQSVYGDPRSSRAIRWRNPYGRAKLATEVALRRAAGRFGKPVYVLRLGHVCGSLQEISIAIRTQIKTGNVALPRISHSSNTVYTAAIVGALLQIMEGRPEPGTYDLMNTPRWSWNEVYDYEKSKCGVDGYSPAWVDFAPSSGAPVLRRSLARSVEFLASVQWLRDSFSKLYAHLPTGLNAQAQAWWYTRRARLEMNALRVQRAIPDHLSWRENGKHFFPASQPTAELLARDDVRANLAPRRTAWPEDLADA